MQVGNAGDDRKPEATAGFLGTETAIKTIEDLAAFFFRNTGATVGNAPDYGVAFPVEANFHFTAFWCVANCVVNEIAHEYANRIVVAGNEFTACTAQADFDIFVNCAVRFITLYPFVIIAP